MLHNQSLSYLTTSQTAYLSTLLHMICPKFTLHTYDFFSFFMSSPNISAVMAKQAKARCNRETVRS